MKYFKIRFHGKHQESVVCSKLEDLNGYDDYLCKKYDLPCYTNFFFIEISESAFNDDVNNKIVKIIKLPDEMRLNLK